LPRLFVYHSEQKPGSATDETFKVMERRLMKAIMRPASVVTLLSGFGLLHILAMPFDQTWLWLKLAGVLGLVIFHGVLEVFLARFARGERKRTARFFRILNEVPTVLLVVIVIAVVVRPFS